MKSSNSDFNYSIHTRKNWCKLVWMWFGFVSCYINIWFFFRIRNYLKVHIKLYLYIWKVPNNAGFNLVKACLLIKLPCMKKQPYGYLFIEENIVFCASCGYEGIIYIFLWCCKITIKSILLYIQVFTSTCKSFNQLSIKNE